jgi:hypothetical protein
MPKTLWLQLHIIISKKAAISQKTTAGVAAVKRMMRL